MGPYYRGTSQATGAFFEIFYEQPILMLSIVGILVGIGTFLGLRKKFAKKSE